MILLYHKVALTSPTMWWVHVGAFYRQMVQLSGKEVVYLDQYDPDNSNQVCITFDGVYADVLIYAAPILKSFGYPFELFITSDYIGGDNKFDQGEPLARFASIDELRALVNFGGRLQWHAKTHKKMSEMHDRAEIVAELEVPHDLRDIDPSGFSWFAYPYGAFNDLVKSEAQSRFRGALSVEQGCRTDRFALNRLTVTDETCLTDNKVSLIVASYNYGRFLPEAIESVLAQTYVPDEILIIDDCSDDNTQEIAELLCAQSNGRIRYSRNSENLGTAKNFARAIESTSGEFICFLGADNKILSNYVAESFFSLSSREAYGVAYTDYALFGPRAAKVYEGYPASFRAGERDSYWMIEFPDYRLGVSDFIGKVAFIHGSSMYRRQAYLDAGGYREKSAAQEDYDLFSRILAKGWVPVKVHKTLLEYRQHSRQQANESYHSHQELVLYKRRIQELETYVDLIENSPSWRVMTRLNGMLIRYPRLKTLLLRMGSRTGLIR